VDKAHFYHLIHIKLGIFVRAKQRHSGKPPGMLGNALARTAGRPGVARVAFELFYGIQKADIISVIHYVFLVFFKYRKYYITKLPCGQ
jgi:hypothetical protein